VVAVAVFRVDCAAFSQLSRDPYFFELCPSLEHLRDDFDEIELQLDAGLSLRKLRLSAAYRKFVAAVRPSPENTTATAELIAYVQTRRQRCNERLLLITAETSVLLCEGTSE